MEQAWEAGSQDRFWPSTVSTPRQSSPASFCNLLLATGVITVRNMNNKFLFSTNNYIFLCTLTFYRLFSQRRWVLFYSLELPKIVYFRQNCKDILDIFYESPPFLLVKRFQIPNFWYFSDGPLELYHSISSASIVYPFHTLQMLFSLKNILVQRRTTKHSRQNMINLVLLRK